MPLSIPFMIIIPILASGNTSQKSFSTMNFFILSSPCFLLVTFQHQLIVLFHPLCSVTPFHSTELESVIFKYPGRCLVFLMDQGAHFTYIQTFPGIFKSFFNSLICISLTPIGHVEMIHKHSIRSLSWRAESAYSNKLTIFFKLYCVW